jgi:formimidoylglutamate deiminase
VERLRGKVLLPGFVNAHSHAFQRALRGHVQHRAADGQGLSDSFWTWREAMYGLAETLDPDAIERISTLAFREMVAAGFTTVGEFHYLHHQPDGTPYDDPDELARRVIAAAKTAGIRLVLLYVAYARAGFEVAENPRQRRFLHRHPDNVLAAVSRLQQDGGAFRVGLAPHSMRACPAEWLRAFQPFAAAGGLIHAHVDEQRAEVAASLAEHGRLPLHVFEDAGLLTERFSAVHLTHPDDTEITALARSGGSVVACPTTELDLGDGFLPAERLDGRVGLCIGSDSHAAIDPFAELRAIEWHARALSGHRNVLRSLSSVDPRDGLAARLLAIGTAGGARALDVDAGEIVPGKLADFVAIDATRIEFASARLLPALVFNGSPSAVTDVWVDGRRVHGTD